MVEKKASDLFLTCYAPVKIKIVRQQKEIGQRTTRRLRGIRAVVLFNRNGPHLNVRARVVWTKRIGFRKHVAGLEFIDPPHNMLRELTKLGTTT